jgi:hypothetical protein
LKQPLSISIIGDEPQHVLAADRVGRSSAAFAITHALANVVLAKASLVVQVMIAPWLFRLIEGEDIKKGETSEGQ